MAKEYRKKILVAGVMLSVVGTYGQVPFANVFAPHAQANDGEDSSSESEDEGDDDKDEDKDESEKKVEEKKTEEKKVEEKKAEADKKVAEIRREAAKKSEERRKESVKKELEIRKESEKKRFEAVREREEESKDDAIENESEDEGEDELDDNRYGHASEKIAEAEKHILEQQAEGKNVTIALERLNQAKNTLKTAEGGNDSDDLIKESLKLAHEAEEDDIRGINDAYKFVKKASDRIDQATEKLSRLSVAGGDAAAYQTMIDAASADLKNAKDVLLQGSLLESVASARKAESEAKSAKHAIESALLALGVEDDDLSGDHKSTVAQTVDDLLYVASVEGENGIGKKVREIARAQRDSAEQVDGLIDDAQSRSGFSEFILGPKYGDLKAIEKQVADNQARIDDLKQSANELEDTDLKEVVQEHVDVLTEENVKLQSFVSGKEKQKGIFGWVFRLLQ